MNLLFELQLGEFAAQDVPESGLAPLAAIGRAADEKDPALAVAEHAAHAIGGGVAPTDPAIAGAGRVRRTSENPTGA
ncbi:MAG TPA: hypothetical protein VMF62_18165 [Acetobacteraceae bacterium]|nr:hypothetical protein [Acetobacteraceae bacterium]